MIDLRSDTVTKPSPDMMQAIMNAKVGDDVYAEDPDVNTLQCYVAELLGKDDAIYVPSGSMSNQLGVKVNTNPGDEVILEQDAHIFYFETAAPAIISNVQCRTIHSTYGQMPLDAIEQAIRPNVYYFPKTTLLCLENTHNRHGGTIISLDYIKQVRQLTQQHNIRMHLDGARLWNASIATGITVKEYANYFDTISVCLSKGLGAPVGSVLVGDKQSITKAKRWRKILGGGMRQAGILAAAGLYALTHNIERLVEDHNNAKFFANAISNISGVNVDMNTVQTNMVAFETPDYLPAATLVSKCKDAGVLFNSIAQNKIRIVFHLDVSSEDAVKASEVVRDAILNSK
ncbi:MAG: low-specificity L-threonine aldolase [Ignavibacteria bacterium]|jgi:threonine aldolase|nr:low-specificity L-threonine aldolase [Ignavibacteria bacterium]